MPLGEGVDWLVPTHVPNHWSMVAVHWETQEVRFYDSLPERKRAKADESDVRGY